MAYITTTPRRQESIYAKVLGPQRYVQGWVHTGTSRVWVHTGTSSVWVHTGTSSRLARSWIHTGTSKDWVHKGTSRAGATKVRPAALGMGPRRYVQPRTGSLVKVL